jgi:hypothetical protein
MAGPINNFKTPLNTPQTNNLVLVLGLLEFDLLRILSFMHL